PIPGPTAAGAIIRRPRGRSRRDCRRRGGTAVRDSGEGRAAVLRAGRAKRRGGLSDLSAARRDSARDRAGGRPGARAPSRADRGPSGRPVSTANRWKPHRLAPPADVKGNDRLELRSAERSGARVLSPPGGIRRGLDVGGGRAGLRGWSNRGSRGARSAYRAGGQVARPGRRAWPRAPVLLPRTDAPVRARPAVRVGRSGAGARPPSGL